MPDVEMKCLDCRYLLKGLPEHRCPECGRSFDPDDPATFSTSSEWRFQVAFYWGRARFVIVPLLMAWYWLIIGHVYTQHWVSWPEDAMAFLRILPFGAPLAMIVWLGSPRKTFLIGVLMTVWLPVAIVVVTAAIEEKLFMMSIQDRRMYVNLIYRGDVVYKTRWWPNGNNHIYYNLKTGEKGGGC